SNSVNFLNYLYNLIMARMLGPSGIGELAALISLSGLIGAIPASINLVVIKYVSSAKTEEETGILISWIKREVMKISLFLVLFVILISPFITSFLHISKLMYLIFIAISFLFSIPSLLNKSILQGLLKFKEMITSMFMENTVKLLL